MRSAPGAAGAATGGYRQGDTLYEISLKRANLTITQKLSGKRGHIQKLRKPANRIRHLKLIAMVRKLSRMMSTPTPIISFLAGICFTI